MGEFMGIGMTFPILISEAGVDIRLRTIPYRPFRRWRTYQGRADHPWSAAVERGRSPLPETTAISSKGNRRIGRGHFFQVTGLGHRIPGTGSGTLPSVLCHRFSRLFSPLLAPPYLPFLLCFRRYSTGVHFISRLNRRLKKVTCRKPQAKAMSSTLRSPSRNSRRAACKRN